MYARASLVIEQVIGSGGQARSRVSGLRSKAPLVLRPTIQKGWEPWTGAGARLARVSLASGAAGPLGGDRLVLDIDVGAGSTLILNEVSATLLLPGARGGRSRMEINIHVGDGATLVWLPEPVIAAHGCDHLHDIRVELDLEARLMMREELLLGRSGEVPGSISQHIRVRRGGKPLFNQQLDLGPASAGGDSPAVVGQHRALGSVLVVDPDWEDEPIAARPFAPDAAVLPLNGPAAMVSTVAADSLRLRRNLDQGMELLGPPWSPAARQQQADGEPGAPMPKGNGYEDTVRAPIPAVR
ncbi:urease accessory protein UreD [Arthrobacter monumenti]